MSVLIDRTTEKVTTRQRGNSKEMTNTNDQLKMIDIAFYLPGNRIAMGIANQEARTGISCG